MYQSDLSERELFSIQLPARNEKKTTGPAFRLPKFLNRALRHSIVMTGEEEEGVEEEEEDVPHISLAVTRE